MSGGKLNFLYSKIEQELFGWWRVDAHYSNINNEEQIALVREYNPMEDHELSEMVYNVACLLHALEWYKSGDIGETKYRECVKEFKEKWLHKNPAKMVESYQKDLRAYYEELNKELEESLNGKMD